MEQFLSIILFDSRLGEARRRLPVGRPDGARFGRWARKPNGGTPAELPERERPRGAT